MHSTVLGYFMQQFSFEPISPWFTTLSSFLLPIHHLIMFLSTFQLLENIMLFAGKQSKSSQVGYEYFSICLILRNWDELVLRGCVLHLTTHISMVLGDGVVGLALYPKQTTQWAHPFLMPLHLPFPIALPVFTLASISSWNNRLQESSLSYFLLFPGPLSSALTSRPWRVPEGTCYPTFQITTRTRPEKFYYRTR